MRFRITVITLLTVGALAALVGSALAPSAEASCPDATISQYPAPDGGRLIPSADNGTSPATPVHSGDCRELPFTGSATITLLLAALALMASGLLLHRTVPTRRG